MPLKSNNHAINQSLRRESFFKTLLHFYLWFPFLGWEVNPRGVEVSVLDCDIVVSDFELQSRYYVYFRFNTIKKGMNFLIPSAINLMVSVLFFYDDGFGIK